VRTLGNHTFERAMDGAADLFASPHATAIVGINELSLPCFGKHGLRSGQPFCIR
jgi:hypothetical protein